MPNQPNEFQTKFVNETAGNSFMGKLPSFPSGSVLQPANHYHNSSSSPLNNFISNKLNQNNIVSSLDKLPPTVSHQNNAIQTKDPALSVNKLPPMLPYQGNTIQRTDATKDIIEGTALNSVVRGDIIKDIASNSVSQHQNPKPLPSHQLKHQGTELWDITDAQKRNSAHGWVGHVLFHTCCQLNPIQ